MATMCNFNICHYMCHVDIKARNNAEPQTHELNFQYFCVRYTSIHFGLIEHEDAGYVAQPFLKRC